MVLFPDSNENVCIHKIIAHLRGARNHVPCHMWHKSCNRGYYLIICSSSLSAMNLHTFSVPSNRWINLGSGKEKYPTLRIHGVTHPKIIHRLKVTLMCTFFSCSPVDVMFFFSFTILGCMQFHQLVWVFPTHSYQPMGQVTNMRDLPYTKYIHFYYNSENGSLSTKWFCRYRGPTIS